MNRTVYLALGSNIADRKENLCEAVRQVSEISNTTLKAVSDIYETDPVGYSQQDQFLNMALRIETELEPMSLLSQLQSIEKALKRTTTIRWGPRTIDIDILLFGNEVVNLPELQIPHPRMFERAFVLVPLKDVYIADKLIQYDLNALIDRCQDKYGIRFYEKFPFSPASDIIEGL